MGISVKDLTNSMAASLADAIERGDGAWSQPYHASGPKSPHNPVTGRPYTGMNWLVLAAAANGRSIDHGGWATYRQWQKAGCQVRKGERSVRVLRPITKCCGEKGCREGSLCGDKPRRWWKPYPVFASTQVDGDVPVPDGYERPPPTWDAESVTAMFRECGATWRIQDGVVPHYDLVEDVITTPPPQAFDSVGAWASTLAHEHAHWTGQRTGRFTKHIASAEDRAREELVAELAAVVICSALGVEHEPVEHHAAYLRSWASHLRGVDGGTALTSAAAAASKAAGLVVDAISRGLEARAATTAEAPSRPGLAAVAAQAAPVPERTGGTMAARVAVGHWMLSRTVEGRGDTAVAAAADTFADLLAIPAPTAEPGVEAPPVEDRLAVREWMLARATASGTPPASAAVTIDRILDLPPEAAAPPRVAPAPVQAVSQELATPEPDSRERSGHGFGW